MNFRAHFPIVLLLACSAPGQMAVRAETPVEKAEKTLGLLFDLGLPDSQGAEWVSATILSSELSAAAIIPEEESSFSFSFSRKKTGNSWLLNKQADGTADLIINQGLRIRVRITDGDAEENEEESEKASEGSPADSSKGKVHPVQIAPADLKRDLGLLEKAFARVEAARKKKAASNDDDEDRNFQRNGDLQQLLQNGNALLMFLAHAHRQQQSESVQRLLPQVLRLAKKPEAVVSQTLSELARTRMLGLLQDWQQGGSSEAYAAGLEKLAQDLPRGWQERSGAVELAALLRAQQPSPRTQNGEAAQLATQLLSAKAAEIEQIQTAGNWLLPRSTIVSDDEDSGATVYFRRRGGARPVDRGDSPKGPAFWTEIMQDKHRAAGLLAELLEDRRLLRLPFNENQESPWSGIFNGNSDDEDDDDGETHFYDGIPRPMELREWSSKRLNGITLQAKQNEYYEFSSYSPRLTYEEIKPWLTEAAGLKDEPLAWKYLRRTTSTREPNFHQALGYLIEHGSPETIQRLKEVFSDPAVWGREIEQITPLVQKFLTKLGPEKSEFAVKLEESLKKGIEAQVKAEMGEMGGSATAQQMVRKQLAQIRAVLRPDAADESIGEALARLTEVPEGTDRGAHDDWSVVQGSLKGGSEKAYPLLLQAAAKAKSGSVRASFLRILQTISKTPPANQLDEPTKAALKALLDRDADIEEYEPMGINDPRGLAAWTVAKTLPEQMQREVYAATRRTSYLRARWAKMAAQAIIKGEAPPSVPDASRVPKERVETVVRELGAAAPGEVHARIKALTLDEQLAVIQHTHELAEWPAALTEAYFTISTVITNQADLPDFSKWKGRRLNLAEVEALRGEILRASTGGHPLMVSIHSGGLLGGLRMQISRNQQEMTPEQINRLNVPGLAGKEHPPLLLATGTRIGESLKIAGYYAPVWKEDALNQAWQKEHVKYEAPANEEIKNPRQSPPAYMQALQGWLNNKPEQRSEPAQLIFLGILIKEADPEAPAFFR